MQFGNTLILCPDGTAETVFSTAVSAAIKNTYPESYITAVAGTAVKDLLISHCPSVDEAIDLAESNEYRNVSDVVRILKPQVVINLGGRSVGDGIIGWLASRLAPAYIEIVPTITRDRHMVDCYLRSLLPYGVRLPLPPFPTLFPEAMKESVVEPLLKERNLDPSEPIVAMVPGVGARFQSRAWIHDGWCYLFQSLQRTMGASVVLIGAYEDYELCAGIAAECGPKCINLAGQLRLVETAALLKALALVIAPDCGVAHIAVAAGTPVIGLYGPTDPVFRGPYANDELLINLHDECECSKEQQRTPLRCKNLIPGPGDCMNRIMLEEVVAKVHAVLGPPAQHPAPVRNSENWFWHQHRTADEAGSGVDLA